MIPLCFKCAYYGQAFWILEILWKLPLWHSQATLPYTYKSIPLQLPLIDAQFFKEFILRHLLDGIKNRFVISTFLKEPNISFSCSSFFINLQRKGRGVLEVVETLNVIFGANFSFIDSAFSRVKFFSSSSSSFSGALCGHSSNCSSLSKVTSLTLDYRLISV